MKIIIAPPPHVRGIRLFRGAEKDQRDQREDELCQALLPFAICAVLCLLVLSAAAVPSPDRLFRWAESEQQLHSTALARTRADRRHDLLAHKPQPCRHPAGSQTSINSSATGRPWSPWSRHGWPAKSGLRCQYPSPASVESGLWPTECLWCHIVKLSTRQYPVRDAL